MVVTAAEKSSNLQRKAVIPTHFVAVLMPKIFTDPLCSPKPGATRNTLQDFVL